MAHEQVVSLADRLKQRREELGISQAQAARELDVARTAYRLWELEAAKPSPDRWRLIARWLGVSVTTMLLAEELISDREASQSAEIEFAFGRGGRDWDSVAASKPGDFFAQARALLHDGVASGDITADQASTLGVLFARVGAESTAAMTHGWEAAELRRTLDVDDGAPRRARQVATAVTSDLSSDVQGTVQLLVSELVTNSVRHGPAADGASVDLFLGVGRDRIRVEVADGSTAGARPKSPSADGGYGLTLLASLASRWGAGRERGRNVTWFELDLPMPGV